MCKLMGFENSLRKLIDDHDVQQKSLAKAIDISETTISHWLSGRQEPNPRQRKKLAEFFKINEAELFGGLKSIEVHPQEIPVVGRASAGERGELVKIYETIDPPESISFNHCKAIQVDGDSMSPVAYHGQKVIFSESETIKNGNLVFVRFKSEETYFKRYFKDKRNKLITLTSINPNYPFPPISIEEKEIEFIYKIVGIKF